MRTRKVRAIPAPEDVPVIFSNERVRQLASKAKLPLDTADLPRFAAAIRAAAEAYIRAASVPDDNAVHHQIKGLYSAAARRRHTEVAKRIDALSKRTRDFIDKRSARPSIPWKIPAAAALRDEATRDDACAAIVSLLRIGGHWVGPGSETPEKGRRRPSGKRSRSFVPKLYAPKLWKQPPRREAERDFVMWLQMAYSDVTGKLPTYGADPDWPGSFARMVQICLNKMRSGANAVKMLNELQRRRLLIRKQSEQLPPPPDTSKQ